MTKSKRGTRKTDTVSGGRCGMTRKKATLQLSLNQLANRNEDPCSFAVKGRQLIEECLGPIDADDVQALQLLVDVLMTRYADTLPDGRSTFLAAVRLVEEASVAEGGV